MKISSLITFLFFVCCSACSQEVRIDKKKVNPAIIKTLLEKYPNAKRLKYYALKNSQRIEADFRSQKQNISVTFNANNEIIELEKEIEFEIIKSKRNSRSFSKSSFESRTSLNFSESGSFKITAAITSGPAQAPRPASSTPAIFLRPELISLASII